LESPDRTAFSSADFRSILGHFPTGVVVVTSMTTSGEPVGLAVGSFTSVSLDPPLVAFLPAKTSTSFPLIRNAGRFCVNVLAADQEGVCRVFAQKGGAKFETIPYSVSPLGCPIVEGAVAWIDCYAESVLEAGDHFICIGRVRALSAGRRVMPLLFFQGGYGRFYPSSLAAPA